MRPKQKRTTFGRLSFLVVLALSMSVCGKTIYVDVNAPGTNDGTTWENAYNYLQDALADANSADKPVEIRVAQGVYTPDRNSTTPDGSGDPNATFQLLSEVSIKGAYAGYGQSNPDARDVAAYLTVLSGDLSGNDVAVEDPCDLPFESTREENCFHVLNGSDTDPNAVIEGFTITGGNATSGTVYAANVGGGLFNLGGSPTVTSCIFVANSAGGAEAYGYGGAVMNASYSYPTFTKCTFRHNYATRFGGAIRSYQSAPTMDSCMFIENRSAQGGAVENTYATGLAATIITYCTFWGNVADYYGGGLLNWSSNPDISHCLFAGNITLDPNSIGGGMMNYSCYPTLTNCTIVDNRAGQRGGAIENMDAYPTMVNCIVWGNARGWEDEDLTGSATIAYSDIQHGWAGEGNIDEDPCFANGEGWDPNGTPDDANDDIWVGGDYHVKSPIGRWDPNSQMWVADAEMSPCIDTGSYEYSFGSELFPHGGIINMGVYGATREASMSRCPAGAAGDISNNGFVDIIDLILLASQWLSEDALLAEDATRDGIVDFNDYAFLSANWQQTAAGSCSAEVFYDGFENGEWNNLWVQDEQDDWAISTRREMEGTHSAEVDGPTVDSTLTSIPIDLQGYPCAKVSFSWFLRKYFDTGEYLAFDISTDGGVTWEEWARIEGGPDIEEMWYTFSATVRDIASGTILLRFRATASGATEDGNVDAVSVTACYN